MLSDKEFDKEFDKLNWTELIDLGRMVGAMIIGAERVSDGTTNVGTILYLVWPDGAKSAVHIGGDEWVSIYIAQLEVSK